MVFQKTTTQLDALVVGAGFGGTYQLWKLRNEGYNVKLVEAGKDFGGVWHWNCYPGARVDINAPLYEFSMSEIWKTWSWKERFPDWQELQNYFAHVANTYDLRKDAIFNTSVTAAKFDDLTSKWTVTTDVGQTFEVKYLLLSTGFSAKRYIPDIKGLHSFKGEWLHPSYWPKEGLDLAGKKVAVIGTGSTGVQLVQSLSKEVGELVVFQRTPNLATPMRQVSFSPEEQSRAKADYPAMYENRTATFGGIDFDFAPKPTFQDSPEQRQEFYEKLWADGSFRYWLATYYDMLFDKAANKEAYNFWRDKTRAKINDPKLKDILAPMEQPHAFGCKRVSLENGYFEVYNQDNVGLVDLKATPIEEITEKGIKTSEREMEFDYIIMATGYDAITGGIMKIDIRGPSGTSISEKWKDGTATFLGMSSEGFPNMFFTYGPQAPTALCNGPVCAELQGDWIINAMNYMREKNLSKIEASKESEQAWAKGVHDIANMSLLPTTKSWYMGDNIPGKHREPLIYLGGVPTYYAECQKSAESGYAGFVLS
ncbi:putative cyclopentanone-monooxygenase protein [Coleophoma cylindrospora]|uniref:Putative cyclopentanone-monooxygenase protein n=1 Tax=Coleophoma cylindrospora TaxID=1849047 RepID=A0A3D8S1F2_9HELO|nr:putative cyclopentanone-monooxygenase protein [Coleophoma cylindrospora]